MHRPAPTARNGKRGGFSRVDVGIDPYDVEYKFHECARRLRNQTISRAGNIAARPIFDVRDSMIQTVYQISFVGADDPVRPSKSGDFLRTFVGADAHIGPLECCEFALVFHKTEQFRRADRVVRPYGAKSKPCTIMPIRPYGAKGEINMDSPIVGI